MAQLGDAYLPVCKLVYAREDSDGETRFVGAHHYRLNFFFIDGRHRYEYLFDAVPFRALADVGSCGDDFNAEHRGALLLGIIVTDADGQVVYLIRCQELAKDRDPRVTRADEHNALTLRPIRRQRMPHAVIEPFREAHAPRHKEDEDGVHDRDPEADVKLTTADEGENDVGTADDPDGDEKVHCVDDIYARKRQRIEAKNVEADEEQKAITESPEKLGHG